MINPSLTQSKTDSESVNFLKNIFLSKKYSFDSFKKKMFKVNSSRTLLWIHLGLDFTIGLHM
jgi:hypothetical protein